MGNKISVITVSYNSSKNIRKFLDSLLINKEYILEVIIIENDSKSYWIKITVNSGINCNYTELINDRIKLKKIQCLYHLLLLRKRVYGRHKTSRCIF